MSTLHDAARREILDMLNVTIFRFFRWDSLQSETSRSRNLTLLPCLTYKRSKLKTQVKMAIFAL